MNKNIDLRREEFRKILTLWNIFKTYDYFFVKTIVREYTDDNVIFWDNFVKLIFERGICCQILAQELRTEVEYTLNETQLFRTNKGVTYVTAALSRKLTEGLLLKYINPFLEEMNTLTEPLEIDSSKVGQEKADENIEKVIGLINKLLENVKQFCLELPKELTYIFTKAREAVREKYGDEEAIKIVGSFIFLRLINPVLLTPQKFSSKLVKLNPTSMRSMIIITKITQVCVNQPLVPFKEDYMKPITEYAISKYEYVNDLLKEASINEENPQKALTSDIKPSLLKETGLILIQQFNQFAHNSFEKFSNFCDILKRRQHIWLLQQFLQLIDPSGKTNGKIEIDINKYDGIILDEEDDQCIKHLVEKFDTIIEEYQLKILKMREDILDLQRDINKKAENLHDDLKQNNYTSTKTTNVIPPNVHVPPTQPN